MALLGNTALASSRRWRGRLTAGLAVFLVWGSSCRLSGAAESYPEASVKAVFLYRFAGYVEWPPQAHPPARFTIAVLGAEPVAEALARLLPEHPIGDRPGQVRIAHSVGDLGDAQIIYIGSGYLGNLRDLIATLAHRPVLVVTDQDDALGAGSTVNFLLADHRVRFEISLAAAERAGLKINSQLLSVAIRVETGHLWPSVGCGVESLSGNGPSNCMLRAAIP